MGSEIGPITCRNHRTHHLVLLHVSFTLRRGLDIFLMEEGLHGSETIGLCLVDQINWLSPWLLSTRLNAIRRYATSRGLSRKDFP